MPVKYVQLVHGEDVDETLHLVYGPEMTPGVEHSAAVCEAGFVADDDRGYCSVGSDELAECLQGVEHGLRGASENFDGTGRHGKSVLLGGEGRGCPETDFALRGHGYFAPDDGFDVRCEDFGGTPEFSFGGDGGLGRDPKLSLASVISAGRGMMSMLRAEPAAARSVAKISKMLFLIGLGKGGG